MKFRFTLKSDRSEPPPYWLMGFVDAMDYYKDQLIHKRILKQSDKPGYTNGWAEANITAYTNLQVELKLTLNGRDN